MSGVSVVIPSFNTERYIREAICSAISQGHPDLEIIVVDDGSTDATADIAESFGPPVRVFRQANQGSGTARNRAIAESRGDFIAISTGLDANTRVVTAGAFKLRNGAPITIDDAKQPPPSLDPKPENR